MTGKRSQALRKFFGYAVILTVLQGSFLSAQISRASFSELELQSEYKLVSEPLTTEKVWRLDPDQPNPHLQRWILNRHVELLGLQAKRISKDQVHVSATGLATVAQGYVRPQGPWYRPFQE